MAGAYAAVSWFGVVDNILKAMLDNFENEMMLVCGKEGDKGISIGAHGCVGWTISMGKSLRMGSRFFDLADASMDRSPGHPFPSESKLLLCHPSPQNAHVIRVASPRLQFKISSSPLLHNQPPNVRL